jgi:hypothetical protein
LLVLLGLSAGVRGMFLRCLKCPNMKAFSAQGARKDKSVVIY